MQRLRWLGQNWPGLILEFTNGVFGQRCSGGKLGGIAAMTRHHQISSNGAALPQPWVCSWYSISSGPLALCANVHRGGRIGRWPSIYHALPGVEQIGPARRRFEVIDFSTQLDEAAGPFMDTAAIMANLDLVVSCDSAVCHLAGAMGVPVWLAIPASPDWRWMLNRDDSPWYPTLRLSARAGWAVGAMSFKRWPPPWRQ